MTFPPPYARLDRAFFIYPASKAALPPAAVVLTVCAEGLHNDHCTDLVNHGHRIVAPAHDVQHRAKDFLLHVGNRLHFKRLRESYR